MKCITEPDAGRTHFLGTPFMLSLESIFICVSFRCLSHFLKTLLGRMFKITYVLLSVEMPEC